MICNDEPYTFDSVVRMVLGVGFIICLVWALGYLSSALVPFVAALLIAYLLNPITSFFESKIKSRSLAVMITIVGVIGIIVGIVWTIIPMMASEFAHMGKVMGELTTNKDFAERVKSYLPPEVWEWLRNFIRSKDIQTMFTSDGAATMLEGIAEQVLPGIRGILKGTASFLSGFLGLGIILLYLIFLLADFGKIKSSWQDYLPGRYRQGIVEFLGDFERTMSLYFRGQVTIALLVGVLLSIGFIIIGLPLALVLGMFIGILNIAPYLGAIGIIPAVFLAGLGSLEIGESPWVGIGLVLLVFGVVQAIQEVFLIPKIQGESLGLSPWMILLALSIWGKLLGFLGLLIALPMTCLLLSYYRQLLAQRDQAAGT